MLLSIRIVICLLLLLLLLLWLRRLVWCALSIARLGVCTILWLRLLWLRLLHVRVRGGLPILLLGWGLLVVVLGCWRWIVVRAGALRVITALRLLSPLSPALYNQQQLRKNFCAACMSRHTQILSGSMK